MEILLYVIGVIILTIVLTLYFKKCKVCGSSQLTAGISEDEKWSDRFIVNNRQGNNIDTSSVLHGTIFMSLISSLPEYNNIKHGDNIIISNYPMNPTKKPEISTSFILTGGNFINNNTLFTFNLGDVIITISSLRKQYIPKIGDTIFVYVISIP